LKQNGVESQKNLSITIMLVIITICLTTVRTKANVVQLESVAPNLGTRTQFYKDFADALQIPWHLLAAIDQYEDNISQFRDENLKSLVYENISIKIPADIWSGAISPVEYEQSPLKINLFGGIGRDGDGDGVADIHNEADVISTLVNYLQAFLTVEEALLSYYQNEDARRIILGIARLFEHYDTTELKARVFPIGTWHNYSFENGYGAARGWGGKRSHEGIDIFASYGATVVSTSYGIVEIVGWNEYGGYRVGIRDIYNTYQYYAHLQGFADGIKEGVIVEPGQVIGSVGSTGYGPVGTSGKFAPHLHFGLYKFDGHSEWAFNPYPHLLRWEEK